MAATTADLPEAMQGGTARPMQSLGALTVKDLAELFTVNDTAGNVVARIYWADRLR